MAPLPSLSPPQSTGVDGADRALLRGYSCLDDRSLARPFSLTFPNLLLRSSPPPLPFLASQALHKFFHSLRAIEQNIALRLVAGSGSHSSSTSLWHSTSNLTDRRMQFRRLLKCTSSMAAPAYRRSSPAVLIRSDTSRSYAGPVVIHCPVLPCPVLFLHLSPAPCLDVNGLHIQ